MSCFKKIFISAMASFAVVLFFCVQAVWAHAYLNESYPRAEEQLVGAPSYFSLVFTEMVEAKLSSVQLIGTDGQIVELENINTDAIALKLDFDVPNMVPDVYRVQWQALSVDGHVTQGEYRFSVGVPLPKITPNQAIEIGTSGDWGMELQAEVERTASEAMPIASQSLKPEKSPLKKEGKLNSFRDEVKQTIQPIEQTGAIEHSPLIHSSKIEIQTSRKEMQASRNETQATSEHLHPSHRENHHNDHSFAFTIQRWIMWIGLFILVYPYLSWGTAIDPIKRTHVTVFIGWAMVLIAEIWRIITYLNAIGIDEISIFLQTQTGMLAILRIGFATMFLVFSYVQLNRSVAIGFAIGWIALLTWSGHANPYAAKWSWIEWLLQSIHATLASAWLLGLIGLVISRKETFMIWNERIKRFQQQAKCGFPILIGIGLILAWLRVDWQINETLNINLYFWILIGKIVLTVLLISLILILRNRVEKASVQRMVVFELVLGFALLFCSGWLASTSMN